MKRSLFPELLIAAVALATAAAGAYALSGAPGTVVAVIVFAALALAVAAWLLPAPSQASQAPEQSDDNRHPTTWFHNYWRQRERVNAGTKSMASYQTGLGPQLQHLLAARLGERHGVNVYADPQAARRLFCVRPQDQELWVWVAPSHGQQLGHEEGGPETAPNGLRGSAEAPGIPPAVLARLVRKLENL